MNSVICLDVVTLKPKKKNLDPKYHYGTNTLKNETTLFNSENVTKLTNLAKVC